MSLQLPSTGTNARPNLIEIMRSHTYSASELQASIDEAKIIISQQPSQARENSKVSGGEQDEDLDEGRKRAKMIVVDTSERRLSMLGSSETRVSKRRSSKA